MFTVKRTCENIWRSSFYLRILRKKNKIVWQLLLWVIRLRPRNYECFYFDITNPKPRVVKSLHTWELMGALTRNSVSEMKLKRKAQHNKILCSFWCILRQLWYRWLRSNTEDGRRWFEVTQRRASRQHFHNCTTDTPLGKKETNSLRPDLNNDLNQF